jgi:hypothetical protein
MKTREWNPPSHRFGATRMDDGGWNTRSVLECDGPPPLSVGMKHPSRSQSARGLAHSKTWRFTTLAFCRLALLSTLNSQLSTVFAQSYSIDWSTIDSGGGASTGGVYSVSGTIGQPDAGGPMTNGQYSVTGGFWAFAAAVQTPGAPLLSIVPAGPGQATISWLPATPGFVLQENLSLTTTNWVNSPSGATNPILVPAALPTKFYRLHKP